MSTNERSLILSFIEQTPPILAAENLVILQLRASVNRSWSSGRSALPAVATPAFPDEPPDNDHNIRKGHPEVDHPPTPLRTPHKLLMSVAPGIGSFHNPPQTGSHGRRLALLGDLPCQPTSHQLTAGRGRVVGTIQMHLRPLRHLSQRPQGVKGLTQKRRVVTVGRGADGPQRDAFSVHHRRALDPPFASVHRASTCFLPTTRGLRYAAVHRQVRQLEADEAVVGLQGDLPESLHHSELDPLVTTTAQGALRARLVGDPFVGAAEHKDLDQFLEDNPAGDAPPVAAEWMIGLSLGQESLELHPDGLDDVWLNGGHEAYSFSRSGSVRNSPDDGASVPALHVEALPIDGSSKA